jgi:hypothetical protein
MSLNRTIAAVAAIASSLAVAAPAASAHPGGAGVLEYNKITTISGSAGNDGTTSLTGFVGLGRSHYLLRDEATGALKVENAVSPRIWKAFDASANTLTLRDGFDEPLDPTPAQEAKYFQDGVAKGCYVKTGSADGIDLYKMVDQPQLPCSDSPNTQETDLVDQRTGYLVQRVTTNGAFKQDTRLTYTREHHGAKAAKLLRMTPHPGAKVIDERS